MTEGRGETKDRHFPMLKVACNALTCTVVTEMS